MIVLCAALLLAQAAPETLTLDQAVSEALKANPRIDAARLLALAVEQGQVQASSALLPQISSNISGSAAPRNTRLLTQGIQNPLMLTRVALGFGVNQLLYDFGRVRSLVDAARQRTLAEQQAARATRAQVSLAVTQAYLAALRAEAVERVALETISARETLLDKIRTLADNQLKSELDVQFAAVAVSEAKLLLTTTRNERAAASAELALLMGLRQPRPWTLVDPPSAAATDDPAALVEEALRRNPEAERQRALLDAALQQAKAERRAMLPSVNAIAGAGVIPAHTEPNLRDSFSVAGVAVSIPIFNGKQLESRRAEADLRAQAARRTLTEAENRISRDVAVTLLQIQNAAERQSLANEFVASARTALSLAQARYDLGLSSVVELNQAQLALISAEIQLATARFDGQLQRAILDFHAGRTP